MATETNYIQALTDKLKEQVPFTSEVGNVIKNNEDFFIAAGGAFLTVVGLKFFWKTAGFLAFVGGATILYRAAASNPKIAEVLSKVAEPAKAKAKQEPVSPILEEI
jgi:hypothetical protein